MFIKDDLRKINLVSLAGAVAIYFAAGRLFQDWLYLRQELGRPQNLFASFGTYFARPEPWEIPIYFAGFLIIPVLAFGLYFLYENYRKSLVLAILAGIIGAWIYAGGRFEIPDFFLYFNYLQNQGLMKVLWLIFTKRIFVTKLILLLGALVFVLALWKKPAMSWLNNNRNAAIAKRFEPLFLLLIGFLLFHPNFPIDTHHYNYFIGSVNDHLLGKPLLYETTHLYGLADAYFLALVFKFILPFTYQALALVIFFFFIGFFVGIYYFTKKWLQSSLQAMLATTALLTILFFFQTSPTRSAYLFPAMTPFRFWLLLPVLYLLEGYAKNPKTIYRELAVLVSILAIFWNLESGAAIAAATFATFAFFENFQLKQLVKLTGRFLGYLLAVWGTISLINLGVYHSFPNWLLLFKELRPFGEGIGMSPLPLLGVFEIFVLLYLGVGLWLWQNFREAEQGSAVVLFLAVYGIFSSVYYIGQSTWQNLFLISLPPILIGFYLFRKFPHTSLGRAGFYAFLTIVFVFFAVKVPVELQNRSYADFRGLREISSEDAMLYADAETLRTRFPDNPRLYLIHLADTKLLRYAQKTNALDFYYFFTLYYKEDIEKEISKIKENQPPYVLIGKQKNDQVEYFLSLLPPTYKKTEELQTLEIWRAGASR